jgi:hypothetical protein
MAAVLKVRTELGLSTKRVAGLKAAQSMDVGIFRCVRN